MCFLAVHQAGLTITRPYARGTLCQFDHALHGRNNPGSIVGRGNKVKYLTGRARDPFTHFKSGHFVLLFKMVSLYSKSYLKNAQSSSLRAKRSNLTRNPW